MQHTVVHDVETTVMTLNFGTDRSRQTVQSQIRLLLEDPLASFSLNTLRFGLFVPILGRLQQCFLASENLGTLRYLSYVNC